MGLRSVTKLWAHTHLQDPQADQHSKPTLTVFPFPLPTLSFLHSADGSPGRTGIVAVYPLIPLGGGGKGGSASGRQTEVEGDAEHSRQAGPFTLLANMAAGRPNTPPDITELTLPTFYSPTD